MCDQHDIESLCEGDMLSFAELRFQENVVSATWEHHFSSDDPDTKALLIVARVVQRTDSDTTPGPFMSLMYGPESTKVAEEEEQSPISICP